MPSTYSSNLKIELLANGENAATWGDKTNTNLGTTLEQAIVGYATASFPSDANLTLTYTDTSASQTARALVLNVISAVSLTVTRELIVPTIQKQYIVQNNTTGSQSITVKTSGGSGITVPNGRKAHLYVNGTDVIYMDDFVDINGGAIDGTPIGSSSPSTGAFTTITLTTALAVNQGGTGATTSGAALTNLGATTVGANLLTLPNPSAITFPRLNANNTVSALDAATFRTAIGAGTGSGSVTSVGVSGGTTGLTTSGGPITGSGTVTLGGTLSVGSGGTGATTVAGAQSALSVPPSSRSISAGTGLSGGGDLSADRTLSLANTTVVAGSYTNASITVDAQGRLTTASSGSAVTSVAQSFNGGLISVSGSPVTSSGTLALTVAGTSGGIPYFSSGSAWASSAALAANALVIGGGAGSAPSTTTTGTNVLTALGNAANASGGIATTNGTATLTNKRVDPRVVSAASASTLTPDISAADQYAYTALAVGLTINAPIGTPVDGNRILFRILDNGTSRTLTWNATYTALGVTLPTATTANKMTYVGCVYNAANTRWDVIAVTTQA